MIKLRGTDYKQKFVLKKIIRFILMKFQIKYPDRLITINNSDEMKKTKLTLYIMDGDL